jgi:hypothetical protein
MRQGRQGGLEESSRGRQEKQIKEKVRSKQERQGTEELRMRGARTKRG